MPDLSLAPTGSSFLLGLSLLFSKVVVKVALAIALGTKVMKGGLYFGSEEEMETLVIRSFADFDPAKVVQVGDALQQFPVDGLFAVTRQDFEPVNAEQCVRGRHRGILLWFKGGNFGV